MKIIITERQQKLIGEQTNQELLGGYDNPDYMTTEQLRKILFKIWDNQKRKGIEPKLDEISYDISSITPNTRKDYEILRPIWYEYNGGIENLFEKIKDELLGETFKLENESSGLDTEFTISDINLEQERNVTPSVNIIMTCEVDDQGTVDYFVEREDGHHQIINGTIKDALIEMEYDAPDLIDFLQDKLYKSPIKDIMEKYKVPYWMGVDIPGYN